jgi:hypothetical protein
MAVKIVYSDIPLGAKENAAISATPWEDFAEPGYLPTGVFTGAVATCEPNAWGLSHDYKARGTQQFAMWSKARSNETGAFDNAPVIVIDFTEQYTSTGLTFRFSPDAGEYCTRLSVVWYQGETVKDSGAFFPTSGQYALENTVEAFDKIEITFEATNVPRRRLKLEQITIGVVREFTGRELTSAQFVHEIDLISNTVPVNVLDASFHSSGEAEFLFQRKQPVEAFNDNTLIGVYYIEKGERTSSQNYSITCQDAIGVLELDTYDGGLWLEDTPIETIIDNVIGGAFEIEIDEALAGRTLRGFIPPDGTKRAALQQIAFALGACIDTAGTSKIRLFLPATGEGAEIPAQETYTGGKVTTADMVTDVSVRGYEISDKRPDDEDEFIEFEKVKYVCVGRNYKAKNPNVTAGTLPNKLTFEECYLCNASNAQERADAILAYYMRRNTYSAKHIVRGQNLGDRSAVALPWGDVANANIKKMTISVTGLTVSDSEFLLD